MDLLIFIPPPFLTREAAKLALYMNRQAPFPYGPVSIASFLKKSGFESRVIPLQAFFSNLPDGMPIHEKSSSEIELAYRLKEIIENYVNRFKPRFIGISAHGVYLEYTMRLTLRIIKKLFPEIPVIIGGQVPTFEPYKWFEDEFFPDAVVIREGEKAIQQLLSRGQLSIDGITGIITKNNKNNTISREDVPLLMESDFSIPLDYDLLTLPDGFPFSGLWPVIMYGRGCVYKCNFCTAAAFWEGCIRFKDLSIFKIDVENILKKGVKSIEIGDETINANAEHFKRLCECLEEFDDLSFQTSTRIDKINTGDLRRLKRAHCKTLYVGIETVDKKILKEMNKIAEDFDFEDVLKKVKDEGIDVGVFLLIGHPGSRPENDVLTGEWLSKMLDKGLIDDYCINFFTPHPGTKAGNDQRVKIIEKNRALWTNQYPVFELVDNDGKVIYKREKMSDIFLEISKLKRAAFCPE